MSLKSEVIGNFEGSLDVSAKEAFFDRLFNKAKQVVGADSEA